MERNIIKGNRALAAALGLHYQTIQNLRKRGVLKKATLSDFGKIIIYDLDKVMECLNHSPVKAGRRAAI